MVKTIQRKLSYPLKLKLLYVNYKQVTNLRKSGECLFPIHSCFLSFIITTPISRATKPSKNDPNATRGTGLINAAANHTTDILEPDFRTFPILTVLQPQ